MYSLDMNTNLAIERQAERVHAVRSVGLSQMPSMAQSAGMDAAPRHWGLAGNLKARLALAALTVGVLMLIVANSGGASALVVALVR